MNAADGTISDQPCAAHECKRVVHCAADRLMPCAGLEVSAMGEGGYRQALGQAGRCHPTHNWLPCEGWRQTGRRQDAGEQDALYVIAYLLIPYFCLKHCFGRRQCKLRVLFACPLQNISDTRVQHWLTLSRFLAQNRRTTEVEDLIWKFINTWPDVKVGVLGHPFPPICPGAAKHTLQIGTLRAPEHACTWQLQSMLARKGLGFI